VNSIGIVAGLEPEVRSLRRLPEEFSIAVSGMGAERSYRAAQRLVQSGAQALVSWGCAAALDSRLEPGMLVMPRAVVGASGEAHAVDTEWQQAVIGVLNSRLKVHTGPLVETVRTLATAADKRELLTRSRALAADMESAGVARAARELGVPFLALRAIADGADVAVPQELERAVAADGEIDVGATAARLIVAPWRWPAAVRLGLGFRAALLTLRVTAPALYATARRLEKELTAEGAEEKQPVILA
jgi:adenosylhomocysteine nucleosidase